MPPLLQRLHGRLPQALGDGLGEFVACLVSIAGWDFEPDGHLNDLEGLADLVLLATPAPGDKCPYGFSCLPAEFFEEGFSDYSKNEA